MHRHINQVCFQPDFEFTEPSNNENEIVNPEIFVDKNVQLPQPVVSQLEPPSTPEPLIVTSAPNPSIANETSTTEKRSVKPEIPLTIHNRSKRTRF